MNLEYILLVYVENVLLEDEEHNLYDN
jgi:hypothetical protein